MLYTLIFYLNYIKKNKTKKRKIKQKNNIKIFLKKIKKDFFSTFPWKIIKKKITEINPPKIFIKKTKKKFQNFNITLPFKNIKTSPKKFILIGAEPFKIKHKPAINNKK